MSNFAVRIIFSVFLTFQSLIASTPQSIQTKSQSTKSPFEKISTLYLSSLSSKEATEESERSSIQANNTKHVDAKKVTQVEEYFGNVAQLKTAYTLYNSTPYGIDTSSNKVNLSEATLNELTLFYGDKETPERHVFQKINKTTTTTGLIALQSLIAQPTTDIQKLKTRQEFVQLLINNSDLYEHLSMLLLDIKKSEKSFLSIMKEMETEVERYYQDIFFTISMLKGLNKQAWFMHGGTYLLAGREFFQKVTADLIAASILGVSTWILTNQKVSFFNPFSSYYAMSYGFYAFDNTLNTEMRIISGVIGALNIYSLGSGLHQFNSRLPIVNRLKEKMIHVANVLITTHRDLAQALCVHKEALKVLPEIEENILENLSERKPRRIVSVLKNLHDNTLKAGHATAAFNSKEEIRENFIDSYKFLGYIDAFVSIARLVKESQDQTKASYCFATYAESSTPIIKLESFWHPMIKPEKLILNDICLGYENMPPNGLITGPNAGGKTTAIRSIGLAVLLGQTLGIAPARKAIISPFHNFATYLNVADSEGKESLFQAEMRRAQNLLNSIKELKEDSVSFVIIDEIFTGTNPQEGAAGAYGIAKKLSSFKNSSVLMTTHFIDLTSLSKETKRFTNYKVSVKQVGSTFEFPYKLELGVTDQAIALQLLDQEGFDSDILKDAKEFIARKKEKK